MDMPEAFVSNLFLFIFTLTNMSINLYYLVDFCERDTSTKQLASMGLAQVCPNYLQIIYQLVYIFQVEIHSLQY